jgi:hypothetical protein
MCTGCRHVRKRVSERDLNPHGCDLQVWLLDFRVGAGPQVRELHMCPRPESQLTYMIDIALTTDFSLIAGGAR